MATKKWIFMLHKVNGPGSDDKIKYKQVPWDDPDWDTAPATEVMKCVEAEWIKLRDAVKNGTSVVFAIDNGQMFHLPPGSVLIHFIGYENP